jgi:CBS domain-containing protein
MRTVSDILATKTRQVNMLPASALVIDALRIMKQTNLSYVIVMQEDDFAGIFSERDYSRNVALEGKTSQTCLVSTVMSTGMPKVTQTTTVEECISLILDQRVRYLPVLENGELKGVITIHDILREVIRSREDVFNHRLTDQLMDAGGIY